MGERVKVNKSRLLNWKAEASPLCTQGFRERKARARGKRGELRGSPWPCRREIYLRPAVSPSKERQKERERSVRRSAVTGAKGWAARRAVPLRGGSQASPWRWGGVGAGGSCSTSGKRATRLERCKQNWWKEITLFFLPSANILCCSRSAAGWKKE